MNALVKMPARNNGRRKRHLLALVLFGSNTIAGCVYKYQIISEPYIEAATEWKLTRWTWGQTLHAVLYSSKLSLAVYPHNEGKAVGIMLFPIPGIPLPYGEPADRKLFKVSIMFGESLEFRSNVPPNLEFNPSKTQLKLANGQIILPSGFSNPKSDNCILYTGEVVKFYNDTDQWIAIPEGHKKNCIDLLYNISPPSPKENFTITISGLRKERQDVIVPTIHFKEGLLHPWPPGS